VFRNRWVTAFSIVAMLGFVGLWVADFVEETIIFRPVRLRQDYVYRFKGLTFTEHFIDAPNDGRLNLLWFTADSTSKRSEKGVIVYCHGNADNLVRWGALAHDFVPLGYDIVFWDYRTYGKSTGKLNEANLLADAEAVYRFALQHYPEAGITLYGRSLGTGVAAHLAAAHKPVRLILETPYYNLIDMAERYLPFMPNSYQYKYTLRTDLFLPKAACPVHIFHGTADEVVPYDSGLRLRPLLADTNRFITIPGGKHKDLNTFAQYHAELKRILAP
jgi:pimeloyl-ACP methyl ester carboxylesterase